MSGALVLGGTRSGKSGFAEKWATREAERRNCGVLYVATAERIDDEFDTRVLRHQARRPPDWETHLVPCNLAEWLLTVDSPHVVLVDCLSMLVNNWMYHDGERSDHFQARIDALTDVISQCHPDLSIAVVSSEVGLGIVPEGRETRYYRDVLGAANAAVAAVMDETYLVVAGIPIDLRKWAVPW